METFLMKLSERCSAGRVDGNVILQSVYRTLAQMMQDRGFTLTNLCNDCTELCAEIKAGRPVLRAANSCDTGPSEAFIYIDKEERSGIKTVRALVEAHSDALLVIASIDGPTPFTRREIGDSPRVNFFLAKELIYNVTHHVLVPPHRKLTAEETETVLKRYAALVEQLPQMDLSDPVRKYYNWEVGDVIEICRRGMAQECCMYYRRVAVL